MPLALSIPVLPFARLRAPERAQILEELATLGALLSASALIAPWFYALANLIAEL